MKLTTDLKDFRWWFWTVTLVFMITGVAGWTMGYYAVIALSAIQVLVFLVIEKSCLALTIQVRVVYLALTLFGFWPGVRLYVYAALMVGTLMVVLFDRCGIEVALKKMPWNQGRKS